MTNLLELDATGIAAFLAGLGEKPFRARQVSHWIHQRLVDDVAAMTDLSKSLRERLAGTVEIRGPAVISDATAADGTRKWLLDVGAGNAVEMVYIPEDDRGTLCVSSQAGCALDCAFCSTGKQGFNRNLTTAEIVGQLWHANRSLLADGVSSPWVEQGRAPITNVVMMGMGEPLANYDNVRTALALFLDDNAYGLSRRRVTLSTSGIVPAIDRLRDDCPVALAVSLHAPNDALRDALVPLNRKYPIAELLDACARYLERAPRDFITFEYCMLDGVNDTPEHAAELVRLLKGRVPCKLNLIPFNPFPESGLKRSPRERVTAFARVLQDAGIVTTIRKTRGDDIDAACGQLAGEVQDRTNARARLVQRRTVIPIADGALPDARPPKPAEVANPERSAKVRLELASAYFARGQSQTALEEVKQAIAAKPDMPEAYSLLGLVQASLGDLGPAEESFKRALQLAPTNTDAMHNYGWFLCQQRRFAEADTQFQAILAQPQGRDTARTLLAAGVCQARAGRWADAEKTLSRSFQLDTANPAIAFNLSEVLYRRGEYERARFYLKRVNAVPDYTNAQTLWLAIRIERRLGNGAGVQEFARQLRDRFPQAPETALLDQGRFDE